MLKLSADNLATACIVSIVIYMRLESSLIITTYVGAENSYYNQLLIRDDDEKDIIKLKCSGFEYRLKDCENISNTGSLYYYNWSVLCRIG